MISGITFNIMHFLVGVSSVAKWFIVINFGVLRFRADSLFSSRERVLPFDPTGFVIGDRRTITLAELQECEIRIIEPNVFNLRLAASMSKTSGS